MNGSLISASVTMGQLQRKLDTLSNNLANSNTTGFKRREATFSDLLFQQVNNQTVQQEGGRLTPNGLRVGSGARLGETAVRLEQGAIRETGRMLDFAIAHPNHFFEVATNVNGEMVTRLTRDGAFYLSEDPDNPNALTLVTSNGDYLLDGEQQRINIPLNYKEITLSKEGNLTITLLDDTVVDAGQLQLISVIKPQLLEAVGGNHFQMPDLAALGYAEADVFEVVPGDEGNLMQRSLEASNVDMSREMTELLNTQRHYQFNARSISIADDMMGLVNGLRR
ncbi:flagellar hook-basal body protein [Halalkalibacterium ligniniphilum]|uniref:flagellar hook-basal body protein n=1 Tax=Halalkalibacterium ligniniphilum TaxID=1134413 RepID=UPI00034A04BD|nr:flagellar hook-basal body protein [Halalkalibacterium ligniniphilum]